MQKDLHSKDVGHDNNGYIHYLDRDHVQINEKREDRTDAELTQTVGTTQTVLIQAVTVNVVNVKVAGKGEVDLSCGIWKIRTTILGKWFANLYVFSLLVGLTACFTNMMQSVFQTHLTSFQRQFGIDNTKTGLFETAAKIGSVCTVLFAGHFAKKVHIPMLVGVAGVIQGIVLMVPAFLQFAHPYTLPLVGGQDSNSNNKTNQDNEHYLCNVSLHHNNGSNHDGKSYETNQVAFMIIVIVQALRGITDSFHAGFLPSLYMDDNSLDKRAMGVILGINSVVSDIGAPIGRQINAYLTKIPIDLKNTDMDPKDGRFVAAWWLAFLIFGAGTLVFSFPVMLFPKRLVSKRQQEESLKKAVVSFTTGDTMDDDKSNEGIHHNTVEKSASSGAKRDNTPKPDRKYGKLSLAPRISNHSAVLDTTRQFTRRRSSLLPPVEGPTERKISIDGTMIFDQPIKKKDSVKDGDPIQGSSKLRDLIRDFPKAFLRILRRPVFILIIIDIIFASIPMIGLALFRSVYVTNEYNVPMADVATLSGWTMIAGQTIGTLVSGFLAKRVKTKMGYNFIIVGCYFVALCITPIFIIFGCDNEQIYGFDGQSGGYSNWTEACNCEGTKKLISCGSDGNNYLSPCYAGCEHFNKTLFTNCGGINGNDQNMTLTPGLCETDCHSNFILYIVLHSVQVMVMSMSTIPRRLLVMRMVDPKDRGFAVSIFMFCSTVVAIPSPNIFGKFIDETCLIWDGNYCALYDRTQIRNLLSGIDIGVSGFIQITVLLTIYFFWREEKQVKAKLEQEKMNKKEADMNVKL